MRTLYLSLLFALIFISSVTCKEEGANNANVENLKILRKSVNFAYVAGNNFLDLIRGSTPPHKSWLHSKKILNNKLGFKLTDIVPITQPFVGLITLIFVGQLFVVLVPIVGFCFCCCRCCGKCGGKIKGMDPKRATCKRYIYALFLGIISMVQLAGIVLAFINNQLIHDTLTNSNAEISAVKQFEHGIQLLESSCTNISEAISASENSSTNYVNRKIDGTKFVDLTSDKYCSVLQSDMDKLNIEHELQQMAKKFNEASKSSAKNYAAEFIASISNFKSGDIRPHVRSMIVEAVDKDFDDLKSLLRVHVRRDTSTDNKLQHIVTFLRETIIDKLNYFNKSILVSMKVEFLEYRMYICIGVCCLLLLVVLFYFLGLCFGQCGERPFEDARICNRGVGANLMMAGVAFAFLFTPTIMVFEMALFGAGGTVQTEICRYATNSYDPGVRSLDSLLQSLPGPDALQYINNSIFDSIINKCPSQPMTLAFNLDNNVTSQEINNKMSLIVNKVRNKTRTPTKYFKVIDDALVKIEDEIKSGNERNQHSDNSLELVITEIRSSLNNVKQNVENTFDNGVSVGFESALRDIVKDIYLSPYDNVRCNGVATGSSRIIESACVTFLWPFNGFWYGVGICLLFTIPGIIFAVKLAGLYRRTEKYSADYEEPDYHSYMGFYTNNADNIPMKRPKSAKSNHKNRNSNSNNKESLKQNNPQYLPVYPYDAYE